MSHLRPRIIRPIYHSSFADSISFLKAFPSPFFPLPVTGKTNFPRKNFRVARHATITLAIDGAFIVPLLIKTSNLFRHMFRAAGTKWPSKGHGTIPWNFSFRQSPEREREREAKEGGIALTIDGILFPFGHNSTGPSFPT